MEMSRDLRFAFRLIRKAPAASLVVVLTLGFGIGANGIFFASFYGSALHPLPFSDGVGLGLLGALPLARLVSALLFGSQSLDLPVLSSVIAMLVILGLTASASPARRAASVDPIVALREQ